MLPTLTLEDPIHSEWLYEIKYDGFRALLEWKKNDCYLWSRNGKDLLPLFPELKAFILKNQEQAKEHLPLLIDSELCILQNDFKANFQQIQQRGRMRSPKKIEHASLFRPCKLLVFDLLIQNGKDLTANSYLERKKLLLQMCQDLQFSLSPSIQEETIIQYIPFTAQYNKLKKRMKDFNCEGIIAKMKSSIWQEGKRVNTWKKVKNWKIVSCFLYAYDKSNGYFHVGVFKDEEMIRLGHFKNGVNAEINHALKEAILRNPQNIQNEIIYINPSICLDLYFLEYTSDEFREPYFKELRLDLHPDQCTWEAFKIASAAFPTNVKITHPDKMLWSKESTTKIEFLSYLRDCSYYILPFLKNRPLTLIRSPHGEFGESFYQKSRPESAPEFVQSVMYESNEMIVCNDLQTLIWLGNQLAIEFHIPFHTEKSQFVSEIVLDLDPPSRQYFHLAVKAAIIIKKILDQLGLTGFIKLSGNKGMQLYIPLIDNTYTWGETRIFTEFIAKFLISYDPQSFTIERLKKNRGNKLYVDFIQHAEGKTIIAPYSVRNNEESLVAAPIFWYELNDELKPINFTIETTLYRLNQFGDPFAAFFKSKEHQPFDKVIKLIQK